MLSIHTFGPLRLCLDGEDLPLPASRKTRALLGYLAISSSLHRRDRLCELFWDVPDDPRGALRWSLSKLRRVVNAGEETRLLADRERVQLDTPQLSIDFHEVRQIANGNEASPEELEEAWEKAGPLLLEDCELPNLPNFAIWLEQQRNEVVRLRMRLARRLAVYPPLPPEAAERWAERWLMDAPYDPLAAQYAVAARRRLGREREAGTLAEELTQRFEEAGLEPPDMSIDPSVETAPTMPVREDVVQLEKPRQAIRFARAADGTSLAWASVGSPDNPPLVKAANWLSHLELDWEAPVWSPLFRELARTFHFIRYDERGCGLSDWTVPDISFDTFVSDLELVVDAAGLERFPLLGISQGAAVSIEYAARHPHRVSHLILFGGYTAGWRHLASPEEVKEREAVMVLTETGWGRANPSYRHIFSRTFMPDANTEELAWFDEFQRRTTSPENAVRFLEAFSRIDVRDRLADVKVPTLVIHCRGDLRIPLASGREMAARIPDA
ncbi:alpha/beta hydrolase [Henriciella aquimarina]|uniref:alpha/beta hydrolase n=1 Tax=Henriciella aquimarina TaxID=545261 RepID=UPI001F2936D5|nr:alpha/beta hydrolase [Henriciella aquimarina]